MIFTTPMRLLAAVVLDRSSEEVSRELLRLGQLEFISVRDLTAEWKDRVSPVPSDGTEARIEELRRRLEGFLRMPGTPVRLPVPSLEDRTPLDLAAAEKALDALASEVGAIRDRQKAVQEDILRLSEMRRQLEVFDDLSKPSGLGSAYSFLAIRTGTVPSSRLPALEEELAALPSVLVPWGDPAAPGRSVLVVTLKKDEGRAAPLLARAGWEDGILSEDAHDGGTSRDGKARALQGIDARIAGFRERQGACQTELEDLFRRKGPDLESMWARLRVRELLGRVRTRFARTERTVLFSGWIPGDAAASVEEGIRKAAGGRCHVEWISEKEGREHNQEAPTALNNPGVLRPFEALVRNYAVPEYGSVNPVPFTALAYLVMFGLMFGDAGHGLVLALLGLAGTLAARRSGGDDTLARLILYCGCSAVAAGILFGSYFGMPWLPPVWFDYHGAVAGHGGGGTVRSVYDILGITIKFGLAVLGTGLVLNWINLVRRRRWLTLVLDKGGLAGGWIYAAGTWAAFRFVESGYRTLPDPDLLFWILGLPTLALALKGPVEYLLHPREHRKPFGALTIVDFFMEWIVEVLEIYSGYLANTLSFMRVAGLGIAHVSLMTAFFQIARMLNPEGGFSAAAAAVLVLGNVLVIALEGLSAGIQSLRLNYYEFFSKYFNGTGRAFRPISLGTKE